MRKRLLVGMLAMSVWMSAFTAYAAELGLSGQGTFAEIETVTETMAETEFGMISDVGPGNETAAAAVEETESETVTGGEEERENPIEEVVEKESGTVTETEVETKCETAAETEIAAENENGKGTETGTESEDAVETAMETEAEAEAETEIEIETEMETEILGSADAEEPAEKMESTRRYILSHEGILQEGKISGKISSEDEIVQASGVDFSAVIDYIVQAVMNHEKTISLEEFQIPVGCIDMVIRDVLNDNPRLFYVSFSECEEADGIVIYLFPQYDGIEDEINQAADAYQVAVDQALSNIKSGMSAMEKALALHDYLVTNCIYDYDNYLSNSIPNVSYTAYGALVNKVAVCQGYALAYRDLMQRAGINCIILGSDTMNHAWNMIQINGRWYHVDTTWDDPVNTNINAYCRHTYFMVSDSGMLDRKHDGWSIQSYYEHSYITPVANDAGYDEVFWTDVESEILYYQGNWYYIGDQNGISGFMVRSGGLTKGTSELIHELKSLWSGNDYWFSSYSMLTHYGDALYFFDDDEVFQYKGGAYPNLYYQYKGTDGFLYDIYVSGGVLKGGISTKVYDPKVSVNIVEMKREDFPTSDYLFSDVKIMPGYWKYDGIQYVLTSGYMNGINGTPRFDPDEPLSRAMFATVLYRMAGTPTVKYEHRFKDVTDAGTWYANGVIWAFKQGIVTGYDNGNYGINDNITREQIAKMLYLYAQKKGYNVKTRADLSGFPDEGQISSWAREYMSWAVEVGMITGKNQNGTYYLDPKGQATRAECAAMIQRFLQKYE